MTMHYAHSIRQRHQNNCM